MSELQRLLLASAWNFPTNNRAVNQILDTPIRDSFENLQIWYPDVPYKFRRIGVPTRDSNSRRIFKLCVLGRVKAR